MTRGKKWFLGVLFGLIVWSQLQMWSDKRIFHIYQLYHSNLNSQAENNRLSARNQNLEHEIENMKSGFEAIEREAREELGMIKQNEIFYRLSDDISRQTPKQ